MLEIITITKDDLEGVTSTVISTKALRQDPRVTQTIIDSSETEVAKKVQELAALEGINYIWQKPQGIARAFNAGILQSKADWLWFLNGKDIVHPQLQPESFLYIVQNSSAHSIIFQIELVEMGLVKQHPPMWRLWPCVFDWIPHPSTMIKRSLFETYGLYDETFRIAMDGESWLRFFSRDVVVDTISLPAVMYDQTGISSVQRVSVGLELKRLFKMYIWLMLRKWLQNGKWIFEVWRHTVKLTRERVE